MEKEKEKKRIIGLIDQWGEFVTDVDGFVYWWPGEHKGHLAAHQLRWIAEELDSRNENIKKEIDKFFSRK